MKFIHFTDTHLGKSEEKLEQREEDFHNVFKEVIDKCVSEKVDFVVHSGDIFDRARPPTKTLIFLVKQLLRLKELNIPFYIVPGSHDIGIDGTFISVLDELGLLTNLASPRYRKMDEKRILLSGEKFKDVFICGVEGRRDQISEVYSNLEIKERGKYNIFIFHHITSEIADKFSDIPSSLLPKGFDYYAAGHWHGLAKMQHENGVLVYAGSTEYNELNEMISDKHKYYILAEIKEGKTVLKEIPLHTRSIVFCEVNCDGLDSRSIADKAIENIPKKNDNAILIIKFNGKLKRGVKSEVDRNKINNFALENKYFYTKINISELENPDAPKVSTKSRSALDIEREYLNKQSYSDSEIKIAEKMITLFGKKLSPSELSSVTSDAIQLVKGALIENKENPA